MVNVKDVMSPFGLGNGLKFGFSSVAVQIVDEATEVLT